MLPVLTKNVPSVQCNEKSLSCGIVERLTPFALCTSTLGENFGKSMRKNTVRTSLSHDSLSMKSIAKQRCDTHVRDTLDETLTGRSLNEIDLMANI